MPTLIPALSGAMIVLGIIGVIVGVRRTPQVDPGTVPDRPSQLSTRLRRVNKTTRLLAAAGLAGGIILYLITGIPLILVVIPAAAILLPLLLAPPPSVARIAKLDALEEWSRTLSGVLGSGSGIEEAIRRSLRSTPPAIQPQVSTLVARLRARVSTDEAIRRFADDIDDPTGDLVASYLILGAQIRGEGLAKVLGTLAESVAEEVRAAREVEADLAKPRTTSRWVTIITVVVLAVLALTGDYITPYRSAAGQLLLGLLLVIYGVILLWMRRMAAGDPLPRFLTLEPDPLDAQLAPASLAPAESSTTGADR